MQYASEKEQGLCEHEYHEPYLYHLPRLMVIMAWLLTIIFTIPQAIIFRVLKHPEKDFYQCTTFNFFEELSSPVEIGNTTHLYLGGLTPIQWADLYHTIFNCEVFFAPAIAIVASYTNIYVFLSRFVLFLEQFLR